MQGAAVLSGDDGLARLSLSQLTAAEEAGIAKGSQPIMVVSAQRRRPFAAFLRAHGVSAIVMAVSELPDNRKVEIAASICAQVPSRSETKGPSV